VAIDDYAIVEGAGALLGSIGSKSSAPRATAKQLGALPEHRGRQADGPLHRREAGVRRIAGPPSVQVIASFMDRERIVDVLTAGAAISWTLLLGWSQHPHGQARRMPIDPGPPAMFGGGAPPLVSHGSVGDARGGSPAEEADPAPARDRQKTVKAH
jgi:hypothetical protein